MERNQAQSRRSGSSFTETMSDVAVAAARMPGEEHSDRNTAKVETDRFQGDGHHARFPHSVTEASSIVLQRRDSSSKREWWDFERTRKSEDSPNSGEVHPSKRNNEWKNWAKASKNVSETRKEWKDYKKSKTFSKTSKVSAASQESNLQIKESAHYKD